jgi:type II secretory pathway component PulF
MFFSFLIIGVLLIFVLPEVTSQFNNSQIELPLVTKMMLFASENFLYLIFALITAVFATKKFFSAYLSVEVNRVKFHKFILKTPLLGKVLLAYELEKFSQSILLMLRSGLNFDQSLELASSSINNSFLKKSFQQSHRLLKEGKSFLQPIKSIPTIPLIFIQLIESGYNAGTFEKSFNKIVKLLQDEIESKRTIFLSVLEPILIVTMGLFVLLIVLAILTPIMQMNSIIIS